MLTVNALTSAQHLVIPMNPSLYSMQGTNDLFKSVSKVRNNLNPHLSLLGVIINAHDSIPVIESFGDRIFGTVLFKSINLREYIENWLKKAENDLQNVRNNFLADEADILTNMVKGHSE